MVDVQFYNRPQGITVGDIVALTGAVPREGAELARPITNVAPIDRAGPGDLTFLDNARFSDALASTPAGAILTAERFVARAPAGLNVLRSREPYRAFVKVVRVLYPDALRPASPFETDGIAPTASVHPTAFLGAGVTVDPGAVIGPRAEIGAGSVIAANAVIGGQVQIGRDCHIGANCSIIHSIIGNRVIIHAGCHIGQDGFGYVPSAQGHLKVPQVGRVVIHDDVEIGSGTNIDRGGIRDTVIGQGTKIDNLVQIGHNVAIGQHCVIVAQTGVAGSATLEDFAMVGGASAIAPHVTIGKGASLAARSGVMGDVPPGETWGGAPAKPRMVWLRELAALARLAARSDKVPGPPAG